jgi:hypothetical protein
MRAHSGAARCISYGLDLVRKHATGQHRAIGYWACIAGIERAAEAVIHHEKTSDEANSRCRDRRHPS